MKIKQIPEDFNVTEVSNIQKSSTGPYYYYTLKKKNWNTMDVVERIQTVCHTKIGFAGNKDKYAVTSQLISSIKPINFKLNDVELIPFGRGTLPISLGELVGNHFQIVVRDLENPPSPVSCIPNYFDEQRFSKNNAAIGKALIKKDFAEAVRLINRRECNDFLQKSPNDYIGALKKIPLKLLRLFVNAYQSYIFNETLTKLSKGKEIEYSLGKFIFGDCLPGKIPIVGFTPVDNDIINEIMDKEGISCNDFIIKQIPELTREGELRDASVEVKGLKFGEWEDDDLNQGKHKLTVTFQLSKGSYATIVIKAIFA